MNWYLVKLIRVNDSTTQTTPLIEPYRQDPALFNRDVACSSPDGTWEILYGTLPDYLLEYAQEVQALDRPAAKDLSTTWYPERDEQYEDPVTHEIRVRHLLATDVTQGVPA